MKPLKILLVDDDPEFAKSMAMMLELENHQIEISYDGESGVRKFSEGVFDVTFMDVRLPGMNGVESFFAIRKIKPDAKVIMMTAFSVEQLIEQAIDGGAFGVFNKPLDLDEVLRMLERAKKDRLILLVDDDRDFIQSMVMALEERGYTVLAAYNGQEAVDKVLSNGIDVMILDLRMPVLSGLEVYLDLKKKDRVIPTVIVTGYADEEADTIDLLKSMSVSGCLTKPIDMEELVQNIASLIGKRAN